ncbi:metal ABC transporter permease [Roseateles sp. DC23W]|uniref:Metal ABC transporter permease n=1 Tax=Pelomonas dachongensis TaxID=3299029 RepID=A0ABW7ELN3_9BURK
MTTYELLAAPFVDFGFMRRALVACLALALGSAPVGVLLVLRRMSLVGDAMAHALLPGAALGAAVAGFSLWAMSLGGFLAALAVAVAASWLTQRTAQREDASFTALYLIALAAGVMLVSSRGSSVDLMHLLFGSVLAVDDAALLLVAGVASVSLLALAAAYRPLVVACIDPSWLRQMGAGGWAGTVLLVLAVANLVACFQALGTLMSVGLMMLPATSARFWVARIAPQMAVAALLALLSGVAGLLLSFHGEQASGPAIVLVAGGFYLLSLLFGTREGLLWQGRRGGLA